MQLVAFLLVYQKHCRTFAVIAVITVITVKTMSYETFIHRL